MVTESALLNHVLLVLRNIRPAELEVHMVLGLFPVKGSHAVVGTCGHAHTAANAFIVVLAHHAGFTIFIRSTNWADLNARRILAMLAVDGIISKLKAIRVCQAQLFGDVLAVALPGRRPYRR